MLVEEQEALKIKKYGSIFLNGPMYYSKRLLQMTADRVAIYFNLPQAVMCMAGSLNIRALNGHRFKSKYQGFNGVKV